MLFRCGPGRSQHNGFSLIEMVIAIVVLAAAATAILSAYTTSVARSVDSQVRVQAQAVAAAYMDEIMLQPFADPNTGATGSQEESNRKDFDDIWDYQNIDEDPKDRNGNTIGGLTAYNVTVDVTDSGRTSPNASPANIQVTVSNSANDVSYVLESLREDY